MNFGALRLRRTASRLRTFPKMHGELRHVSRPSDLLEGVNGVRLMRTDRGSVIARANGGTCYMTVVLDGHTLCPLAGCHADGTASNAPQIGQQAPPATNKKFDDLVVDLNQYVNPSDIVGSKFTRAGRICPPHCK